MQPCIMMQHKPWEESLCCYLSIFCLSVTPTLCLYLPVSCLPMSLHHSSISGNGCYSNPAEYSLHSFIEQSHRPVGKLITTHITHPTPRKKQDHNNLFCYPFFMWLTSTFIICQWRQLSDLFWLVYRYVRFNLLHNTALFWQTAEATPPLTSFTAQYYNNPHLQ